MDEDDLLELFWRLLAYLEFIWPVLFFILDLGVKTRYLDWLAMKLEVWKVRFRTTMPLRLS